MRMHLFVIIAAMAFLLMGSEADGSCTTILVGDKLTADGAVIHAHNEDMGFKSVGRLWSVRKGTHGPAETIEEWAFFWELAMRLGIPLRIGSLTAEKRPTTDELLDVMNL